MTVAVRVRGPSGTQDHSESELPLVLGSGPEAAVALGAADQAAAAAFIGLRGKRFYVQAAPGTTSLAVNDEPLSGASHWLRAGDEIRLGADRLLVEEVGEVLVLACPGEAEPATEPPVLLGGEERTEGATDGETIRPDEALKPAPPTSRRWQTALWIPTLVLVVAAWFVFTAQPVRVVVEPVPESLEIEGGLFTPALGERFLLREGRYVASARLEGYRPLGADAGEIGAARDRKKMATPTGFEPVLPA